MEWHGEVRMTGSIPPPRKGHTLVEFPGTSSLILYGGLSRENVYLGDMYLLNLLRAAWTKVEYVGGGPAPPPRSLHTMTAISQATLVLFGGDTGNPDSPTQLNDVWTFDMRSRMWRQVSASRPVEGLISPESDRRIPSPRSMHTAVFGDLPLPLGPAIYVYGGKTSGDSTTVYRLCISTWSWEFLRTENFETQDVQLPQSRIQHAAVWWPPGRGMVMVGGKHDSTFLSDMWLFCPSDENSPNGGPARWWHWRRLHVDFSSCALNIANMGFAGHSLLHLEYNPNYVILWGGVHGDVATLAPATSATLIDLQARSAQQLTMQGVAPAFGRIMHTLSACTRGKEHLMVLYGGCGLDGTPVASVHISSFRQTGSVNPQEYSKIGHAPTNDDAGIVPEMRYRSDNAPRVDPSVSGTRANGHQEEALTNPTSSPVIADEKEVLEICSGIPPSTSAPAIRRGTPLSGRILDVTEVGHFVSVIINGKEFKGVLVTSPATARSVENASEASPEPENSSFTKKMNLENVSGATPSGTAERVVKRARTNSRELFMSSPDLLSEEPKQATENDNEDTEIAETAGAYGRYGVNPSSPTEKSGEKIMDPAVTRLRIGHEVALGAKNVSPGGQTRTHQVHSSAPTALSSSANTHDRNGTDGAASTGNKFENLQDQKASRAPPPFLPNVRDEINENEVIDLG